MVQVRQINAQPATTRKITFKKFFFKYLFQIISCFMMLFFTIIRGVSKYYWNSRGY